MTSRTPSISMMVLMACCLFLFTAFFPKTNLKSKDIRTLARENETAVVSEDSVVMFLSIMTGPDNIDRRDALRTTWLSTLPDDWVYEFLSDISTDESDLVSFDIGSKTNKTTNHREGVTSYSLLNQLHMQRALAHHPNLKYYMRIDDDTFFCHENLNLESLPTERLYAGRFWSGDPIRADESFVLLTRDVVNFIVHPPFPIQHEFFGGLAFSRFLSPFDINEYNSDDLLPNPKHNGKILGHPSKITQPFCGRLLSSHHVSPDLIKQLWEEKLRSGGLKPAHWVSLKNIEDFAQRRRKWMWKGY